MADVLHHFYARYGYDRGKVKTVVHGEKYVGVMLEDGQIGVCSSLHVRIPERELAFGSPDLEHTVHRIVYNAYLNALVNHKAQCEDRKDIFDHIDFRERGPLVMVGYFRPLVRKFLDSGIAISVFDLIGDDEALTPLDQLDGALQSARQVILTSTSMANGTFHDILGKTRDRTDVFLLGPSSILHPDMFTFRNVKKVYGSVFRPYDQRVLDLISQGHGTQSFQRYGQKVNI